MAKRKYISQDKENDDGYADVDCPECGATINTRFQRGRSWRKLHCPVCQNHVTVSIASEKALLVQLRRADPD